MLVLSRKNRESMVVGGGGGFLGLLRITVLEVTGGKVKLGLEVDGDIRVDRLEIWEQKRAAAEMVSRRLDPEAPYAGNCF